MNKSFHENTAIIPRIFALKPQRRLAACVVILAALSGCSADDSDGEPSGHEIGAEPDGTLPALNLKNEERLNKVAEVELPGRRIKWFEPEPGMLVEVEFGQPEAIEEPSNASIPERYQLLTGKEAPLALREAHARWQTLRPLGPLLPDTQPLPVELTATPKAHDKGRYEGWTTEDSFRSAYCRVTDRFWPTLPAGRPETERGLFWVNSSTFEDRTEYFRAGVFVRTGSLTVNFGCANDPNVVIGSEAVPAGYYMGIRCDSAINRWVSSKVRNVNSSGIGIAGSYYHCVNYHF